MAEFGQPQRSATTDANAGVVNPPAKKQVVSTTVGTNVRELSSSDIAVEQIGSTLGSALSSMLVKESNNINANREIDARARQGLDTAVNSVDKEKQRTGWEKAVFGENIEYRAAQQRAVENGVQASYLEELAGVDGYAGDTPEQYHVRLKKKNDELLSQYDNDPDTKQKVTAALAQSNQKLANAHYKSHYAYNQLQQQETVRTRMMQDLDGFNLERNSNITQEERLEHLENAKGFFSEKGKPDGMTPVAYRALQLDVVKTHMKAGNMGALKAAQAAGFDKNLSAGEQAQWDGALDAYDAQFGQKVDLARTTADINIANAVTIDQVQHAVSTKEANLEELFKGLSGTQKSLLIMARGNLDIAKDDSAVRKQIADQEEALRKAREQAIEDTDQGLLDSIFIAQEQMKQSIDLATTPEEKNAAIEKYYTFMGEVGQDMSVSTANILKKERAETNATAAIAALRKEEEKTRAAANKKIAELDVQAKRDQGIADYFATSDPTRKAALQTELALTTKEKAQGFDTHLLAGAQNLIGGEKPPTVQDFGIALRSDPTLQEWVKGEMLRTNEVSPMLQTLMQATVQGTDNLYDENGNVTDMGLATVTMVDKLLETPKGVDLIGGKEAARTWRLRANAVEAGGGKEFADKKIETYAQNRARVDAVGFSWKPIIGDQTRHSWMEAKLIKQGIQSPSDQLIATNLQDYREDLIAFGNDRNEADNAFFQRLNNKTKVFNSTLSPEAQYLNEVTKWSVEDLITNAEQHNLMTGKYGDLTGGRVTVKSSKEIPNLTWYTKPGVQGVFASSPSSNNELFLSTDEMRSLEGYITQQQELQALVNKRRAEAKQNEFGMPHGSFR